jgi:hypothetical protein
MPPAKTDLLALKKAAADAIEALAVAAEANLTEEAKSRPAAGIWVKNLRALVRDLDSRWAPLSTCVVSSAVAETEAHAK